VVLRCVTPGHLTILGRDILVVASMCRKCARLPWPPPPSHHKIIARLIVALYTRACSTVRARLLMTPEHKS
jgi:hypothetical protein